MVQEWRSEDNLWLVLSFFMGSKAQTQATGIHSKYFYLLSNLVGPKTIFNWQNYMTIIIFYGHKVCLNDALLSVLSSFVFSIIIK